MLPSHLRDSCGIDPRGALNLLHHLQESSQAPHTLLVHRDERVRLVQASLYIHYPPMGSGSVKRDRQGGRGGEGEMEGVGVEKGKFCNGGREERGTSDNTAQSE